MNKYFASQDQQSLAPELQKRIDSYYQYLSESGRLAIYRKSYDTYYGHAGNHRSDGISRSGDQGELSLLHSNEYANLVRHTITLTTSSRPAMECRAANSDYKSQAQTILGNGLLEYYLKESHLEKHLIQAVEIALILNCAWIVAEWDTTLGNELGADSETGEIIRDGDIKYSTKTPLDVIFDYSRENADDHDWVIIRSYKNKYDLAAQYTEFADQITALGDEGSKKELFRLTDVKSQGVESVEIPYYTFYHKRSPALPNGRITTFLNDNLVLFDSAIPYRKLPVVRIAPSEKVLSAFGHSPTQDLLGIQDALNGLISAVVTNQTTFGVQNIWVKPGHNLNVSEIASGLNLFESTEKPEGLNLTNTPPEIFNFMQFLIQRMETLSGVNSTARGNPEASLKSGAALALVQSMAIQFNSGLQQSYARLLEDIGTLTINHLQDFAHSPRVAMIAGKNNRSYVKEFKAEDINQIQRVYVDMGNPLAKTTSGRLQIAEDLLSKNLIKDANQYISVLTTGRLEPVIEDEQTEMMTIRDENEAMANGEKPIVVATDDHLKHIQGHKVTIASVEARKNPEVVQSVLEHIQEHINALQTVNPFLLQALNQPSLQQPPMNQPMPPPVSDMVDAQNPIQSEVEGINQPNLPTNPLTNEQWNPASGGL
jgi:hypothetical protein